MAASLNMAAFGGAHTAGIFSDMTVDGPIIGTLVAIIDRARNLPNKRTMGKQDPYCAARLGKEAKKTHTDKRGGQTPRWDQELRFTVHDSPDYHRIKVSVFNDDRKTELIGDTFIDLHPVIHPGGGQSDAWHALDCKGKYAGEIRIEFTYYDTRPKAEKPVSEKKRESSSHRDGSSPAVSGPRGARGARESIPIKRRPLPIDPTAAASSPPSTSTPEHRGLQGVRAGPREIGSPRHAQDPASVHPAPVHSSRRPVPEASPVAAAPPPAAATPPNPRTSNPALAHPDDHFDMSYAAPKPYEVKPVDALPRHVTDTTHGRAMSQDDLHAARAPLDAMHAHSAPVVPTQHSYESHEQSQDAYSDPSYHVAPLRSSRDNLRKHDHSPVEYRPNSYVDTSPAYDDAHSRRRQSAMQPTVEDEDFDLPPPPPAHRKDAATIPHQHAYSSPKLYGGESPNLYTNDSPHPYANDSPHPYANDSPNPYANDSPNPYANDSPNPYANGSPNPYASNSPTPYESDSPAPLSFARHPEPPPEPTYDLQRHPYAVPDFDHRQPTERRYTHPRPAQSNSRPVSRDAMAPSPLRHETSLPAALVAGFDATRGQRDSYHAPPAYDHPLRLRQYSEPPEYTLPVQAHELVHYQAPPPQDSYYDHDPPEEPRRRSPMNEYAPVYRPRAHSPNPSPRHSPNPVDGPSRSMPTRKSVSPRPPPPDERRLSGVPFGPDDFNVLNPSLSKPADDEPERPGSRMEINDKGQIVTFSGRVVDASDHLPIDNWAPEPEPKGTVKEKNPRVRATLNGSRSLQEAQLREDRYRRDRTERDRIAAAADVTFGTADPVPSTALVMTRRPDAFDPSSALVLAGSDPYDRRPVSRGFDSAHPVSRGFDSVRPTSRGFDSARPVSRGFDSVRPTSRGYDSSSTRPTSRGYEPSPRAREALRERHIPNSYAGRHSAAPPIPAKIPLDRGQQNEDMALSLELQSIDIGPGSGGAGRRPRTRGREYGAYV